MVQKKMIGFHPMLYRIGMRMTLWDNEIDYHFNDLFDKENEDEKYEGIEEGGNIYGDEEEIKGQEEGHKEPQWEEVP